MKAPLLLALLLLVAACSSDPQSQGAEESEGVVPATYAPEDPVFRDFLSTLPTLQRDILADAKVTFAELERAYLATVACIEDQGIRVVLQGLELDGSYQLGTGGFATEEELINSSSFEITEDCTDEYLFHVHAFYQIENLERFGPDPDPFTEQVSNLIGECMAELGTPVASPVPVGYHEWSLRLESMGGSAWMDFRTCEGQHAGSGP